jgi:hypothetical protein
MPGSGYSELANWNGAQIVARSKPRDSTPNTLSTSTASVKSRAKPGGLPEEVIGSEISSSQNAPKLNDVDVKRALPLRLADVSVSLVRAKFH